MAALALDFCDRDFFFQVFMKLLAAGASFFHGAVKRIVCLCLGREPKWLIALRGLVWVCLIKPIHEKG